MFDEHILEGKSIEELEDMLENQYFEHSSDYKSLINALIKHPASSKNRVDELKIELFIQSIWKENITNNRFPILKDKDVAVFFDQSKINYLKARESSCLNKIHQAKYADVIYELDKKNTSFADSAINHYLEVAEICYEKEWDFKLIDAVGRALSLALFRKNDLLITKSAIKLIEYLDLFFLHNRPRGFGNILRIINSNEKKLKSWININTFEERVIQLIENNSEPSQPNYNIHRFLLESLLNFEEVKQNKSKRNSIQRKIASAYYCEGEYVAATRSNLAGASFLEESLRVHVSIGSDVAEVEGIKKRIVEINQLAREKEMGIFQFLTQFPNFENHPVLLKYNSGSEDFLFNMLQFDSLLLPKYSYFLESSRKEFSLSGFIFEQTYLKNGLRIKTINAINANINQEEINKTVEAKINQTAIMETVRKIEFISLSLLDRIFMLINKQYPTYSKGLISKLESSGIVDSTRKELINHGIRLYNQKDYISSMHILVFQIEGILRDILEKCEGKTFNYKNNVMRELTLGTIIEKLTEKSIVDYDLLKYIELNLSEIQGKNLRNEIAHGNYSSNIFSRCNNQILLYILLKLA